MAILAHGPGALVAYSTEVAPSLPSRTRVTGGGTDAEPGYLIRRATTQWAHQIQLLGSSGRTRCGPWGRDGGERDGLLRGGAAPHQTVRRLHYDLRRAVASMRVPIAVAQRKSAGPITQKSVDRNHPAIPTVLVVQGRTPDAFGMISRFESARGHFWLDGATSRREAETSALATFAADPSVTSWLSSDPRQLLYPEKS